MIKIVLADDHEIFLQGLMSLLKEEENLKVVRSNRNGANAWESIKTLTPDIAVLDYRMQGMNGIEIAHEIKNHELPTKAILLTMHDSPILMMQAEEANIAGYILKETAFENLVSAIDIVANGGTFLPSNKETKKSDHSLPLSYRESMVLTAIAEGNTTKEIALLLNIKPKTVETYRARITEKLDLHTIADMTRYAIHIGLVK